MAIFQIQRLQAEFENEDNHDFEVRLLYNKKIKILYKKFKLKTFKKLEYLLIISIRF